MEKGIKLVEASGQIYQEQTLIIPRKLRREVTLLPHQLLLHLLVADWYKLDRYRRTTEADLGVLGGITLDEEGKVCVEPDLCQIACLGGRGIRSNICSERYGVRIRDRLGGRALDVGREHGLVCRAGGVDGGLFVDVGAVSESDAEHGLCGPQVWLERGRVNEVEVELAVLALVPERGRAVERGRKCRERQRDVGQIRGWQRWQRERALGTGTATVGDGIECRDRLSLGQLEEREDCGGSEEEEHRE
jgi:hypothetical protein